MGGVGVLVCCMCNVWCVSVLHRKGMAVGPSHMNTLVNNAVTRRHPGTYFSKSEEALDPVYDKISLTTEAPCTSHI